MSNELNPYFNGIKTEEDIAQAHADAEAFLGANGRIEYPLAKNVEPNVVLETAEYGKIWYGDLTMDVPTRNKLERLSTAIGAEIFISNQ